MIKIIPNFLPYPLFKYLKSIVENDIKYLTGVTINFDGGYSNYIL